MIAVKRGHVIEGKPVVVCADRTGITDSPDNPDTDQHTWADRIPVNPVGWNDPRALPYIAGKWLKKNTGPTRTT